MYLRRAAECMERLEEGEASTSLGESRNKGKEIESNSAWLDIRFEDLIGCLETVNDDVRKTDDLLNHTIQMVF